MFHIKSIDKTRPYVKRKTQFLRICVRKSCHSCRAIAQTKPQHVEQTPAPQQHSTSTSANATIARQMYSIYTRSRSGPFQQTRGTRKKSTKDALCCEMQQQQRWCKCNWHCGKRALAGGQTGLYCNGISIYRANIGASAKKTATTHYTSASNHRSSSVQDRDQEKWLRRG